MGIYGLVFVLGDDSIADCGCAVTLIVWDLRGVEKMSWIGRKNGGRNIYSLK